jgi:site-specific DNA-methyltransferase (adenine-specific)
VNQILLGNCLDLLKDIPDSSIDLIITSPPYCLNKEYEKTVTYNDYCIMMENIFKETERVLCPGKYAVYNFGDFNSGNRFYKSDIPGCYPATINYFKWGVEKAGLDLQATRIWRKQFVRMGIPFVCNTHPRPVFDYEHVWTFRKKNGSNKEFVTDRKLTQRAVLGEGWTSKADIKIHCAAFPVELPTWAIQVYSKDNTNIVLDPFAGSGTTGIAAMNLGRQYILMEQSPEYYQIICERLYENENNINEIR